MTDLYDKLELTALICLTLFAKWLMSEEPIPDNETEKSRRLRKKRTYGGIIAGCICAYSGHVPLQASFEVLSDDNLTIPLVILLAISGEHIFRALITKLPDWINMFVDVWIKSRSN
jgi:hypothetical protein